MSTPSRHSPTLVQPDSLTAHAAAAREWDAIVVGAGPAGAAAAHQLATGGATVLLVDKAAFPRPKVCGCCLSAAALGAIAQMGLDDLVWSAGAVPISMACLAAGTARATVRVRSAAISRAAFDSALVTRAVAAGAAFLPATMALACETDEPESVCVEFRSGADPLRVVAHAKLLLVADGLDGGCLRRRPAFAVTREAGSHVGVAAIVAHGPAHYEPGVISMTTARGGYVGVVRLEDGQLNVAAAFAPALVRDRGGAAAAASAILRDADLPAIPSLAGASWRGTPALTRRRALIEQPRVMVIGDAAGYIEPFTGEGMAWALASGVAAARIALARLRGTLAPNEPAWTIEHRRLIAARQRVCRAVAWTLRRPRIASAAVRVISRWPAAAVPIVRRLESPPKLQPAARSVP